MCPSRNDGAINLEPFVQSKCTYEGQSESLKHLIPDMYGREYTVKFYKFGTISKYTGTGIGWFMTSSYLIMTSYPTQSSVNTFIDTTWCMQSLYSCLQVGVAVIEGNAKGQN